MTSPQKEKKLSFGVELQTDGSEAVEYKFDVLPNADGFEVHDFLSDLLDEDEPEAEEEEEGEEEEEPRNESEKEKELSRKEFVWDVATLRNDEGDEYGEEYYREAEEVEEESTPLSSTISTAEKLEEEEQQPEEPYHVYTEIPAEVLAEREAIISKIKELENEQAELRRKNKLLELWVSRNMKKMQQRMTPSDTTKTAEQMEEVYKQALREYKIRVDEILSQQSEISFELQNYTQKVHVAKEEDYRIFNAFLDRQREICIGLVFAKTGKRITEKAMNSLIRRQIVRRGILERDRHNYIMLQNCLEDLNTRVKIAETLGEGMTAMDYEMLHIAHVGYKDRLDERDRELEKLRIKIAETVNGVAQYKEKEVCIAEDIEFEQGNLEEHRDANTKVRERLNKAHVTLNVTRDTLNEKRSEAGLLVARHELIEMERMMNERDELIKGIREIQNEIKQYQPAKEEMKRRLSARLKLV